MIGKGSSISSTLGALRYGQDQQKEAEQVYSYLIAGDTPEEIAREFRAVQELNDNCERNTLSFILSPTISDGNNLDQRELGELTKKFIQEMKLGERQAVAYVHRDKEHTHVHLYVNRIDLNGRAYNDSFIGKQSQLAAERTARELGMQTVREVQYERSIQLSGIRSEIRNIHERTIGEGRSRNLESYIARMREQQVKVIPSINKAGNLQGFRFEYKGHNLKASEVHRSLSGSSLLRSIEKQRSVELAGRSVGVAPGLARAVAKKVIKVVIDKGIGI